MLSTIEEVRNLTAGVEGWLTDDEGELLFNLARACSGRGAIVEIGSWKGKSTIWLGKGTMAGNRATVWAVDPHTGSEEHHQAFGKVWTFDDFRRNIIASGLEGIVVPVLKPSKDAAIEFKSPVELIFIDGSHDYDSVKADFEAWFPKVTEGGIMAFHDSIHGDGPRRVVEDNVYTSKNFTVARLAGSITYARKVARNSPRDRLANLTAMYIRRTPQGLREVMPKPIRKLGRKLARL